MLSFIGLCLLLLAGHFLRSSVRVFQRLYLPSCVIGGLLGLAVIQTARAAGAPVPPAWTAGWSALPGLLINVVFACLFLGVTLPTVSGLARRAGWQLAYGQIVAWGQYVVGIGLVLVWLGSSFGLPEVFGGVLPVGFEGGHGTAAGMGEVFARRGLSAGKDLALASATAGILSAILVGMALINWAARRGHTVRRLDPASVPEDDSIGIIPVGRRPSAGTLPVSSTAIEAFTLHLAVVGVAILIGWCLRTDLAHIEGLLPDVARLPAIAGSPLSALLLGIAKHDLLSSIPLFPLCMLGGLVVQGVEQRYDRHKLLDPGLVRRIQNTALDFLVVAAIATINLRVIQAGWLPLCILVAGGILWNVFCVLVLARRLLPNAWFERSIAEMGQSMGVTATGLLLLRVVDPDYESPAADAFACKQLLHEPFMGGGLWTSMAVPLIAVWGGWPVFGIALAAVLIWIVVAVAAKTVGRT